MNVCFGKPLMKNEGLIALCLLTGFVDNVTI